MKVFFDYDQSPDYEDAKQEVRKMKEKEYEEGLSYHTSTVINTKSIIGKKIINTEIGEGFLILTLE